MSHFIAFRSKKNQNENSIYRYLSHAEGTFTKLRVKPDVYPISQKCFDSLHKNQQLLILVPGKKNERNIVLIRHLEI